MGLPLFHKIKTVNNHMAITRKTIDPHQLYHRTFSCYVSYFLPSYVSSFFSCGRLYTVSLNKSYIEHWIHWTSNCVEPFSTTKEPQCTLKLKFEMLTLLFCDHMFPIKCPQVSSKKGFPLEANAIAQLPRTNIWHTSKKICESPTRNNLAHIPFTKSTVSGNVLLTHHYNIERVPLIVG